jgi:hypothetical protein
LIAAYAFDCCFCAIEENAVKKPAVDPSETLDVTMVVPSSSMITSPMGETVWWGPMWC